MTDGGRSPMLEGPFAPVSAEIVTSKLRVIGEVPRDLDGVYLRNGPNPRWAPIGRYHWFDGDGMLHAAHFHDGRVTYRNRWIETRPGRPGPDARPAGARLPSPARAARLSRDLDCRGAPR